MADRQLTKAEDYLAEAEAKLTKGGGTCCAGAGRVRANEDAACELYVKAGNAFKVAKEWHRAGNAFSEVAAMQLKNDRKTEAGMNYVEAAKCFKKVSPSDCEDCLVKASDVYADVGRGKTAAKQVLALAELYEEQGNLARALEEFQRAADLFASEDLASSTTKCRLAVAMHSGTLGDYARAEEIFESLGTEALSNKLLKYTCCEHYVRAGLCQLAADFSGKGLRSKIGEYCDSSPAFADSRERGFLVRLAEAAGKEDVEEFNEAVRSYESVTRLPKWEAEIIRKIRKNIGPDLR